MDKYTWLRLECGVENRMSKDYGPFEYLQIVYNNLTTTDGIEIASYDPTKSEWHLLSHEGVWGAKLKELGIEFDEKDGKLWWSDIVIWGNGTNTVIGLTEAQQADREASGQAVIAIAGHLGIGIAVGRWPEAVHRIKAEIDQRTIKARIDGQALAATMEDEELAFLRFYKEKVYSCLGPADSDIERMIKEQYEKKTGKKVPKAYSED